MPFNFNLYGLCERFAVCNQHRRSELVVLGLRKKVCRDEYGVRSPVGNDEYFRGAGYHVDIYYAVHQLFGERHKYVAGADNHIGLGYALRAVGKRGYRLSSADLEHPVCPRDASGIQNFGLYLAVGLYGRGHNYVSHPRDFCRDHIH